MLQRNAVAYLVIGGAALALATTPALAQCTATGAPAAFAGAVDFAAGAAVNSSIAAINAANTVFLTQTTAFVSAPGNPAPGQEGGGVWARGVGGEFNTKNTGTATFALGGVPQPGNVTCETKTNIKFAGFQVGTDMARLNIGGWNVHIGTTAGYLSSKVSDNTPGGLINTPGATTGTIEVPFIGVYAAATFGGFFVDGQVRRDYYQNRVNTPGGNLFNQEVDGRGYSVAANIGYNWRLGSNWYLEPSAGVVASWVELDPLTAAGSAVTGVGVVPPGIIQVDRIQSTLGRASVRFGTDIATSTINWSPFATISVYHEFNNSVSSSLATSGIVPQLTANLQTSQLGTYGQFGVGIAAQLVNTGWLGYLRADYRNGDKIEGYSLNGGVRYQFTPEAPMVSALAANLPRKAPPLAVATTYNWTGFYIGANAGVLNGDARWSFIGQPDVKARFAGAAAGGQLGYDWQIGRWVLGLEGSADWSNAHGATGCPQNVFLLNCENKVDFLGTATARVGYAFWDRAIGYVKGGLAVGHSEQRIVCNTAAQPLVIFVPPAVPAGCPAVTSGQTRAGWTAGFGTEFALTRNWTVKGETNYFNLGSQNVAGVPLTVPATVKTDGFLSTVAVNYRFLPI